MYKDVRRRDRTLVIVDTESRDANRALCMSTTLDFNEDHGLFPE